MAKLTLLYDGKEQDSFDLSSGSAMIGREEDCDIKIDNIGVSRHHAKVERIGGIYVVADQNSNNGTFVNGKKITKHNLNSGDEIFIGKHVLVFNIGSEEVAKPAPEKETDFQGVNTMAVSTKEIDKVIKRQTIIKTRASLKVSTDAGERVLPISKMIFLMGKSNICDIRFSGAFVRDFQALLYYEDDAYHLVALGGWKAVKVNGNTIDKHVLQNNDVITCGANKVVFTQAGTK